MKKPKKKSKDVMVTIELKEVAAMVREHIKLLEDVKVFVDECGCCDYDKHRALSVRLALALGALDRAASVEE